MTMQQKSSLVLMIAALAAGPLVGAATAQPAKAPNFSGSYRCAPEPSSCQTSGQTFTVMQSGDNLAIKSDNGDFASGTVTSNISMSVGGPWNMVGVVLPDGRIQWSNGTLWRKE
jgi:hypothetical protein